MFHISVNPQVRFASGWSPHMCRTNDVRLGNRFQWLETQKRWWVVWALRTGNEEEEKSPFSDEACQGSFGFDVIPLCLCHRCQLSKASVVFWHVPCWKQNEQRKHPELLVDSRAHYEANDRTTWWLEIKLASQRKSARKLFFFSNSEQDDSATCQPTWEDPSVAEKLSKFAKHSHWWCCLHTPSSHFFCSPNLVDG